MTLHTKYCSQSFGTYIKSINPHNKPPLYKSGNWSTTGWGDLPKAYIISRTKIYKDKLILHTTLMHWASLVAQSVKNLPATWETWVPSLGWEDPLEEGMATHSSILAWRFPKDRGAWWAVVHTVAELNSTEWHSTVLLSITHTICPTERINRILNPWFGQSR